MGSNYSVATIGLEDKDISALNRILVLSQRRKRIYSISNEAPNRADIIIVNADLEIAVAKTIQLARGSQPIIYATSNPAGYDAPNKIKLPFLGSKAIRMLDQVVVHNIGDMPDIDISDDNSLYELNQVSTNAVEETEYREQGMQVLVLDDSASIRKQMEIVLKAKKLIPVMAETGEEAMGLLDRKHFDIAFLDVVLPGIDGYQVCKKIKQNKNIPVVMLTSRSSPFDKVRGSLAGCDMYLTKPVSQEDFNRALEKCLKKPLNRNSSLFRSLRGL